ncbi:hypothetical protein [Saccharopolyspora phatthalungensis]|uniref:SRPBCC family protein n=1 Tax=Saccharopolyspora phatthalungensis TaxID=664693 RepID=A0A840Q0B1_9PSEU|nr:hypothetical protein [Saccharopolyspora phatthalungensis]MBB5155972.1 hypothetical protein [Saccharopolyspora phatthalungensis]
MSEEIKDTWTRPPDVTSPAWEVTDRSVTVDDFALEPDFDAMEHMVADVPPEKMYTTLRHLDLLTVHSRVADLAMWVRDLPERLKRRVPPRVPTRLTFDDLVASGEWVLLGEQPGREVVYGAAGRFWTPIVRMESVSAEDFAQYHRSRRGKIVASLSVRPYGRHSSLMTYDIRTTLDDLISRWVFGMYWRTVSPFVRSIMRATLRTAAKQASSAQK